MAERRLYDEIYTAVPMIYTVHLLTFIELHTDRLS